LDDPSSVQVLHGALRDRLTRFNTLRDRLTARYKLSKDPELFIVELLRLIKSEGVPNPLSTDNQVKSLYDDFSFLISHGPIPYILEDEICYSCAASGIESKHEALLQKSKDDIRVVCIGMICQNCRGEGKTNQTLPYKLFLGRPEQEGVEAVIHTLEDPVEIAYNAFLEEFIAPPSIDLEKTLPSRAVFGNMVLVPAIKTITIQCPAGCGGSGIIRTVERSQRTLGIRCAYCQGGGRVCGTIHYYPFIEKSIYLDINFVEHYSGGNLIPYIDFIDL
jgi:hypothetical protein